MLVKKLPGNFASVEVKVVDCPNLTEEPFRLTTPGLGGSPTLIEIGGNAFMMPLADLTKIYNVKEIIEKSLDGADSNLYAIGAGAGPFPSIGKNSEGIYNVKISKQGDIENRSYISKVEGPNEECEVGRVKPCENKLGILGNLFACQGIEGKVLKVHCKKRIGGLNFIESIRLALTEHFGSKAVGLGGIFLLKQGAAKQHVMRDFPKKPINSEAELNKWLAFYEMPAVLNAVGTLVTQEMDVDLRLQHFHSFSDKWAGHYHYDTTPDIVEYEGYFNIGEKVVRVDKPKNTHQLGRD